MSLKDTMMGYSFALQKRESTLMSLTHKADLLSGVSFPAIYAVPLKQLFSQKIDGQREALAKNARLILNALVETIIQVEDRNFLLAALPTLDGILFDRKQLVYEIYALMAKEKKGEDNRLVHRLQKILSNPSGYDVSSYDAAARILAVILTTCPDKTVLFLEQQKTLMNFILGQLGSGKQDDKELLSPLVIVVSLGQLFLAPKIAEMFIKCGGIDYLVRYLSIYGGDLPISYYTLIALWLLSYEPSASKYFYDPEKGIIRAVVESMQRVAREKVVRAAMLIFRNVAERIPEAIEVMVDNKLIKIIDLELKKNIKDKDLKEDLVEVGSILEKNYRILSTYEKYLKEIKASKLTWNPVHTEKFWRENIKKFEDNDFGLIRTLVSLLDSADETTQAVAAYDLGEFCRFHPFGKQVVDKMDGKKKIMDRIGSEVSQIREQALIAVQKMMIHNWDNVKA